MYSIYSTLFFAFVMITFPVSEQKESAGVKYKIDSPEACTLKKDLTEISGLSYDAKKNRFYAINDEEGIIFAIDQASCESDIIVDFDENGDYEGIEQVGKHIYVLESKGKLYKYNTEKDKITKVYDTYLDPHNNSEGLCLDEQSNSLLIACKGDDRLSKKESARNIHSIYRFGLDTKEVDKEPWMYIKDADLLKYYEKSLSYFKWVRSSIARDRFYSFAPSAIAINPIDNKLYVLSTRGRLLVVLTRDAEVDHIYYLDNGAYIQPEGISFDPEGNMYISNEGRGHRGNILKIENKKG